VSLEEHVEVGRLRVAAFGDLEGSPLGTSEQHTPALACQQVRQLLRCYVVAEALRLIGHIMRSELFSDFLGFILERLTFNSILLLGGAALKPR
jgi:hypothetical protein